jgi:nanoRNase/pAp phosphatase (c-di-AMP/oligoRNAs hydrolase)
MTTSTTDRLRKFNALFSGSDNVLIAINADPDAIACAMAVKRMLWRRVAGVVISHVNMIKRPDNIAMIRLLGVKLTPFEEIDVNRFDRFVIVDSQPSHHESFSRFTPDAVIDHHPHTGCKAPFLDIRPQYGSNAGILTEYLKAAKIKPSTKLATALFLAIKTDTNNFERQSQIEDVRAFHYLYRYANIHLARKIEQADLRIDFLKYFNDAIQKMQMRKGKVFVHLGGVSNPDVIVLIADFFMRVNAVKWSIISGVWKGRLVVVLRNDGIRQNAGTLAKEGFAGFGSAGGHKSAARAEIPLEKLPGPFSNENEKEIQRWIIDRMDKPRKTSKKRASNNLGTPGGKPSVKRENGRHDG